eukprot:TRINITY_DN1927_c1_g1_i1.p1 TRINITY_DN1927_c1_g1~~TRINITY_DN1927_c1_g1_i1.p1  ORF type:complete len:119 (-),score=56.06 TRINITY_DN1927_c1_g1_i1:283-639(-)
MQHPQQAAISIVAVSSLGHIAMYSSEDLTLRLYTVNGRHLVSSHSPERIGCIHISKSASIIVCGNEDGTIVFRRLHDLRVVQRVQLRQRIRCMTPSADEKLLLVAVEDNSVVIIAPDV